MIARNKNIPVLRFKEFPVDIKVSKLGELVTFKSGGTPPKDNPDFWDGEIPWISAASMYGKYYSESDRTLTKKGLKNGSKLAAKGSLLLLVRGSMLFNKIPIGIAKIDVAFNQDVKALIIKENSSAEFLYQWFLSQENVLLNKVVGTGIGAGKLDTEELQNLSLSIPSLLEQQKIASFFSAIDEKIRQLTRKKELLEQYKKGVMQQLFSGKLRFKDEKGKAYPKWESVALIDVADPNVKWSFTGGPFGSNLKAEDYTEEGVRILQLQNIGDGIFYNDYKIYTSKQKADELISCNIYPGEILISKMGDPVARACRVPSQDKRYLMASDGIRFLPDSSKYDIDFIFHSINHSSFRNKALSLSTGSTRKRIGLTELKTIEFSIPILSEQKKIAKFLCSIDNKIEKLTIQIAETQNFKKGLLQQMFV